MQGVSPGVIFGFSLLFAVSDSWRRFMRAGVCRSASLLSLPVAIFGERSESYRLRRTLLSRFEPAYMVRIEGDVYSQIRTGLC